MEVIVNKRSSGIAEVSFVIPCGDSDLLGEVSAFEAAMYIANKAYDYQYALNRVYKDTNAMKKDVADLLKTAKADARNLHKQMTGV